MTNTPIIIAIDGPAASGKGTLARALAEKLGFAYLDTGKLYRYVGWSVLQAGGDPRDEAAAVAVAENLGSPPSPPASGGGEPSDGGEGIVSLLSDPALAHDEAGVAASQVAAIPAVRAALLSFQKTFAARPPQGVKGAILDGRDIGTVICPDAPFKFFVTADTAIRAERRTKELHSNGISVTYDAVLADMRERDARDSERATAPLKPADDAVILDTSDLSIEEALETMLSTIGA